MKNNCVIDDKKPLVYWVPGPINSYSSHILYTLHDKYYNNLKICNRYINIILAQPMKKATMQSAGFKMYQKKARKSQLIIHGNFFNFKLL